MSNDKQSSCLRLIPQVVGEVSTGDFGIDLHAKI